MYKINTSYQNKNSIQKNNNNNCNNNYQNNNMINEDLKKMHLLPPHCPMTPKTYTDFFSHNHNHNHNNHNNNTYKMETVKHPREGYKHKIEHNNFYGDFKKDALHFTSSNYKFIDEDNNVNAKSNDENEDENKNENIKMYKDTKPQRHFAMPMQINGSNKVADLFDNCMNKKTFEYKRFSTISPHNKQWLDNPLFTNDISQETQKLKNNYMDNREEDNMNLYSSIFDDMYAMSREQTEYTTSAIVEKIENKLKNNNLEDDNITKIKATKANKLDKLLEAREKLRQSNNTIN